MKSAWLDPVRWTGTLNISHNYRSSEVKKYSDMGSICERKSKYYFRKYIYNTICLKWSIYSFRSDAVLFHYRDLKKTNQMWYGSLHYIKLSQNRDTHIYLNVTTRIPSSDFFIYLSSQKRFLWKIDNTFISTHLCCNCNDGQNICLSTAGFSL